MAKRKKYTKEFKEEAVKLVTEQGYKQSVAANRWHDLFYYQTAS